MNVRVACLGSNLESKVALEALLAIKANVVGLITLPSGCSRGVSDYFDLHSYAKLHNIKAIDTIDINSADTVQAIQALRVDYLFVLGWSQLLKCEVLNSVSKFVVGSHPTPLPLRRGRAPIPWTILEGERNSAVTLFEMSEKIDDGPILLQSSFQISDRPYAEELYSKVAETLADSFCDLYEKLNNNENLELIHKNKECSYRGKRTVKDGYLDFNLTSNQLDKLIRAVSKPFPGAYFYYRDMKVVVWCCEYYNGPERVGINGQILSKQNEKLIVRVSDGCLELHNFEISGQQVPISVFTIGDVLNLRLQDEVFELKQRVTQLELLVKKLVESNNA